MKSYGTEHVHNLAHVETMRIVFGVKTWMSFGLGIVLIGSIGCGGGDYTSAKQYSVSSDGGGPIVDGDHGGGGAGVADGGQGGGTPYDGSSGAGGAPSCDDQNECTNDGFDGLSCQHYALDHSHSCANGAGRCDGNVKACCTTLDPSCCAGCKILVGNSFQCVAACPNGQTCDPISVQCHF